MDINKLHYLRKFLEIDDHKYSQEWKAVKTQIDNFDKYTSEIRNININECNKKRIDFIGHRSLDCE
jgi:hypothetical protein